MIVCGGIADALKKVALATTMSCQEVAEAMGKELKRLADSLNELMEEYIDYIEVPEIPSFLAELPYYKMKFNIPKQKHYPKIRATARSNC